MTSTPIMEVPQTGYAPAQRTARSGSNAESMQFSEAMDFASGEGKAEVSDEPQVRGSGTGNDVKVHAEKTEAENTGRKDIRKADEAENAEAVADKEAVEELEEKTEEVLEEIAKELEVSPEEVQEAMEALGLTVMDLLSQGNMAALVAELKGMQSVELLTDADLFAQITRLTSGVQEELEQLADNLGVSVEELEQMLEEQLTMEKEAVVTEETHQQTNAADTVFATDDAEAQIMAEKALDEQMQTGKENAESKDVVSVSESAEEIAGDGETAEFTGKQSETEDGSFKGFKDENDGQKEAFQRGQITGQPVISELRTAAAPAVDNLFEGEFDLQQTRELIDQIADYVRVHHSEKVSSMEIQLNPASLGTVNLQVVAQDGVISARLTAQDEAVRAALESQVAQLKESLEAQGLKVDAVEVTAQSHAFEQNLQQQDKDQRQQTAGARKNGRRILNLDEIDQEEMLEEEMSDADRLQIEMMRMGGNKLNFRV